MAKGPKAVAVEWKRCLACGAVAPGRVTQARCWRAVRDGGRWRRCGGRLVATTNRFKEEARDGEEGGGGE